MVPTFCIFPSATGSHRIYSSAAAAAAASSVQPEGKKIDGVWGPKVFFFFLIFQIYPTVLWEVWGLDSAAGQWTGGVMVGVILKDILERVCQPKVASVPHGCPESLLWDAWSQKSSSELNFFFYRDFIFNQMEHFLNFISRR